MGQGQSTNTSTTHSSSTAMSHPSVVNGKHQSSDQVVEDNVSNHQACSEQRYHQPNKTTSSSQKGVEKSSKDKSRSQRNPGSMQNPKATLQKDYELSSTRLSMLLEFSIGLGAVIFAIFVAVCISQSAAFGPIPQSLSLDNASTSVLLGQTEHLVQTARQAVFNLPEPPDLTNFGPFDPQASKQERLGNLTTLQVDLTELKTLNDRLKEGITRDVAFAIERTGWLGLCKSMGFLRRALFDVDVDTDALSRRSRAMRSSIQQQLNLFENAKFLATSRLTSAASAQSTLCGWDEATLKSNRDWVESWYLGSNNATHALKEAKDKADNLRATSVNLNLGAKRLQSQADHILAKDPLKQGSCSTSYVKPLADTFLQVIDTLGVGEEIRNAFRMGIKAYWF